MPIKLAVKAADYVPFSRLKVIQDDLKSLSKENFEALKNEITEHGFSFAFHVWDDGKDLCILDGTQRHRVLSSMSVGSDQLVPVNYVEAPDIKTAVRKLLGAAGSYGKPEEEGLYELMHKFNIAPIEVPNIRLPGIDMPKFLNGYFEEEAEGLTDADATPDVRKTDIRLGDLFQLGPHRVLCGDSTQAVAIQVLMNGEKADMVFTDPPYGINLDTDYSKLESKGAKGIKHRAVIGDDVEFDPTHLFDLADEVFLFGANYYCWHLPRGGSWVVWDKMSKGENIGMMDGKIGNNFELVWSKAKHQGLLCRELSWEWYNQSEDEKKVHPTQKPVKVAEWFFERWGKDAKLVVDLYLGSGSTLIACEKTGRKCYGMEIDESYCDVIIRRYLKFTGRNDVYRIEKDGTKTQWAEFESNKNP